MKTLETNLEQNKNVSLPLFFSTSVEYLRFHGTYLSPGSTTTSSFAGFTGNTVSVTFSSSPALKSIPFSAVCSIEGVLFPPWEHKMRK